MSMPVSLKDGRYTLHKSIGDIAQSEVYLALDMEANCLVVVKLMRIGKRALGTNTGQRKILDKLKEEARMLVNLPHDHIVRIYDYGEEEQGNEILGYIVTHFYDAESLQKWFRSHQNPLQVAEVASLLEQAGDAIQYIHRRGLVHRDIKPQNFLVQSGKDSSALPTLLLTDFGIAQYVGGDVTQDSRGTPHYKAPEQWDRKQPPLRANDQYALAVMAYYLLTGRYPFNGDRDQLEWEHKNAVPDAPSTCLGCSHIPPAVDAVILRALKKLPGERYLSVQAFTKAFRDACESELEPVAEPEGNTGLPGLEKQEAIAPHTSLPLREPSLPEAQSSETKEPFEGKAEKDNLTAQVSTFFDQLFEVHSVITDPNFFERIASPNVQDPAGYFDHQRPKNASLEDLHREKIADFFTRNIVQRQTDFRLGVSSQDQLRSFGFLREMVPTYGTLLCFGLNPTQWLPGASTRCILWSGNDTNHGWSDDQDYPGNLITQFESGRNFLQKHLRLTREIGRDERSEKLEIPLTALEEALANALVHREYMNRTAPVSIDIFDDRIEISNPGTLPAPMTLDLLEEGHKSHPRNPQIARIFYLHEYVENVGSGIQRMQGFLKEAKLKPAQFALSKDKMFKVIFYRPKQSPKERVPKEPSLLKWGLNAIRTGSPMWVRPLTILLVFLLIIMGSLLFSFLNSVVSAPNQNTLCDRNCVIDGGTLNIRLKDMASSLQSKGDNSACVYWYWASQEDPTDGEARIAYQNYFFQKTTQDPCGVTISSSSYINLVTVVHGNNGLDSSSRAILQGVALRQQEFNDAHPGGPLLHIFLVKITDSSDQQSLAQQILAATKGNGQDTIAGVVGLPAGSETLISALSSYHIPMISIMPTGDNPPISFLLSVAPSLKDQADATINVIKNEATNPSAPLKVISFYKSGDTYDRQIVDTFSQEAQGQPIDSLPSQAYTNVDDIIQTVQSIDGLSVLYLAGSADDALRLQTQLHQRGILLQVIGPADMYQWIYGNYTSGDMQNLVGLQFTAFAYHDVSNISDRGGSQCILPGSTSTASQYDMPDDYLQDFGSGGVYFGSAYTHNIASSDTILAYDAVSLMDTAGTNAGNSLSIQTLWRALRTFTPTHPFSGFSGQISFPAGKSSPYEKAVLLITITKQGNSIRNTITPIPATSTTVWEGCY